MMWLPHKRFLILLCVLLNSSCFLLSPSNTKPLVKIPKSWSKESNFIINDSINLPDMIWWQQFNSIELNQLIHSALQHNNNLNIAITNIDYARSQLEQVKLNWIPGMTLLSGYSQMPILGNPGAFVIAAPLYVLNIFQQFKQLKSAQAMVQGSLHAKDCVRLMLISQVSASFFTLIAQQEALNLYKKLIKHRRSYLKLVKNNYHFGLTDQDKIDELESEIQQTQSQLDVTQHNIIVSKNTLHFLLNENPGDLRIETTFKSIDTNQLVPGNLPVTVLNNRPDVQEAYDLLRAANADIGAVTANLLPSITLGAYLGTGKAIGGINLSEAYLSTPVVNLPVFAQIAASKAQYKAKYIKYIETIRQALRDVDNDLSAYLAYSNQLTNNLSAYRHENKQCNWVKQRYHHGINNKIDVIQCRIKLDQFELMLNRNKLEKMMVIITLYQDLAGGYHAQ